MKARVANVRNTAKEYRSYREEVSEIFLYCSMISLHQDYGIGCGRLPLVAKYLDAAQVQFGIDIHNKNYDWAIAQLQKRAAAYCSITEIRWPVDKDIPWRREEREKAMLLLDIANEVHTACWCNWVLSIRKASEEWGDAWGNKRFCDLLEITKRYMRPVCEAQDEYDKAAAFENIRRAAEAALRQTVRVADSNELESERIAEEYIEEVSRRAVKQILEERRSKKIKSMPLMSDDALRKLAESIPLERRRPWTRVNNL